MTADLIIRFSLAEPQEMRVRISTLEGRVVKVLQNGLLVAGTHGFSWDRTGTEGTRLKAGVYLVQINGSAYRVVVTD